MSKAAPDDIAVTLTKDEFVIVTRELTKVHAFDPMHGAAKSAFTKLIRAAQTTRAARDRAAEMAMRQAEPDNGDRFY